MSARLYPVQTSERIKHGRRRFFGAAAAAIAAIRLGKSTAARAQAASMKATGLPIEGDMPPLTGATAWINTSPLTSADLRGKVVLVEFWTYTCINWRRSHAYVRAWAEKYNEHGLIVIGVHTPEFPFEGEVENVRRAVQDMKIRYPIAVDSDHAIWDAFQNNYWPAFYFVDAQGRIRHHQFGEGSYEQSEMIIQLLLVQAGSAGIGHELTTVNGQGFEAAADWADLRSPENYLGYDRTDNFSSAGGAVLGKSHDYAVPTRLTLNQWALSGDWTMESGFVAPNAAGGRIAYRFHARDLHLVMGSADPSKSIRFRITIDGAAPGTDHGLDVDAEGQGSVQEPRLYQLARQSRPITDRTFEIEFLDAGSRAYDFTFG
ncbi:MAG TPA: redoxin domain-containing protein [Acetobacteraceae bacterium]|nr:redoxin domain-containing protein [Acetobacteraceae bacterium]